MKLQLAVGAEVIKELFREDFVDSKIRVRKRRLHYHQLLINQQLEELWETGAKEEGMETLFQNWFVHVSGSAERVKFVQDSEKVDELEILIDLAENDINKSIVVFDTDRKTSSSNPEIRFCNFETFGLDSKHQILMDNLKELDQKGRPVNKLFDLFETPIDLQVTQNKSADLLARYLSRFYKEETDNIIVQDRYFIKNENNFNEYVKPYIHKDCNLIIHIPIEDGAKHKRRIEQKYNAKVKCNDSSLMHESYILTNSFKIRLGYRLAQFGENGKTMRDIVNIQKA